MIGTALQTTLTVIFGSLAGGITNSLAIWMLFHPYEPPRLFRRPVRFLQGAIPKNKQRLAGAIGRTVGTRLLTPEDLARTASDPRFRAAFDTQLAGFLRGLLEERRGSVADMLSPALALEVRLLLEEAAGNLLHRLDDYLASETFRETARRRAASLAAEIADQPLGDLLTPERETALTEAAERFIAEAVGGESFERAISDYVDRGAERLLAPGRTFQDLLPTGLVAAVERAIAGYLPIALERMARLLEDPGARARVETVLHEVLERFQRDLRFHQRLVASLLITPETVERVLRAVEQEGAAKVAEILHEPAMRDAMARSVNEAVVEFLRRPVDAVLGRTGDPSVDQAKQTAGGWALALARDPQTRGFLVEKLHATLRAAERRTWGDVFRHVPPDRIADLVVELARSEQARAVYGEAAKGLVGKILEKPVGRLADHLPPDAPERIERAIAEPLWTWLQEQVPAIAQQVDVARQVEQKILEFPMPRVEELIRSVTERELVLIVRLGYVLGAFIGLLSASLGLILR